MDSYVVESKFHYKGFTCCVVMPYTAQRSGYVGVTKKHPLYGKDKSGFIEGMSFDEILNKGIGDRRDTSILRKCLEKTGKVSIESYFDVYGGITYSGGGKRNKYPVSGNLWWFGFDCGHYGDGHDFETAKGLFKSSPEIYNAIMSLAELFGDERCAHIRSEQFVREECKRLADQLYHFEKLQPKEVVICR